MRGESTLATCKLRKTPEITEFEYVDIEKAELEAFADLVRQGKDFPVPITDVIHGVEILESTVRAAATGEVIKFN